jgi:hypothetical protein
MDNCISCSRCNKKYINDNENLMNDFGCDRFNRFYKLFVKCRESKKEAKRQQKETQKLSIECVICKHKFEDHESYINLYFGYDKMNQRHEVCKNCRWVQIKIQRERKQCAIKKSTKCKTCDKDICECKIVLNGVEVDKRVKCDICCRYIVRTDMKRHLRTIQCKVK